LTYPLQKAKTPHYLVDRNVSAIDALDHYNFWTQLVEYYSKCSLTFDTDRLIAISGIAKILQGTFGDAYCAGIWKYGLHDYLLWRVLREGFRKTAQPPAYLAPTWSWASANGGVEFQVMDTGYDDVQIVAEVVQTDIVLASSDPTGQVLSGSITLRGMLSTALLYWEFATQEYSVLVKPTIGDIEAKRPRQFREIGHIVHIDDPVTIGQPAGGFKLHFMPIKLVPRTGGYIGLLLLPTGRRGQFERVGIFHFNPHGMYAPRSSLEKFLSAENNDWLEYENFDGEKYTITIV
jgi:hypothetical protein